MAPRDRRCRGPQTPRAVAASGTSTWPSRGEAPRESPAPCRSCPPRRAQVDPQQILERQADYSIVERPGDGLPHASRIVPRACRPHRRRCNSGVRRIRVRPRGRGTRWAAAMRCRTARLLACRRSTSCSVTSGLATITSLASTLEATAGAERFTQVAFTAEAIVESPGTATQLSWPSRRRSPARRSLLQSGDPEAVADRHHGPAARDGERVARLEEFAQRHRVVVSPTVRRVPDLRRRWG